MSKNSVGWMYAYFQPIIVLHFLVHCGHTASETLLEQNLWRCWLLLLNMEKGMCNFLIGGYSLFHSAFILYVYFISVWTEHLAQFPVQRQLQWRGFPALLQREVFFGPELQWLDLFWLHRSLHACWALPWLQEQECGCVLSQLYCILDKSNDILWRPRHRKTNFFWLGTCCDKYHPIK